MSATIKSLEGLLRALDMCTGESCVIDILSNANIPVSELERYYSWNDDHYTRNLLAKTKKFEVLLVCWEKGQSSAIHDFESNEAWIHPVSGKLKEERFIKSKDGEGLIQVSSVCLGKNDFSYMKNINIHRYTNVYDARTVSLVVFSPPIDKLRVYDEKTGESETAEIWYDKQHKLLAAQQYDSETELAE